MINEATGRPSTTGLMADAFAHLSKLLETEIRLVRTELGEKISQAVRAVAILLVSAVLLVAALILVLQGIVQLLVYFGMQPFAASFTVGIVIAAIGGIAIFIALRNLSASNLAPNRTVEQLGKDVHVLKGSDHMSGEASSADIERDAESERAGLIETLDQLRENLKPANVLDEVLAGAKISMSDVSDRVWHTAKNNPIPSVLIGLGAAMLLGVGQKLKSHEARKSDDWSASKRFPESRPSVGAPAQSQRSPLIKTASSSAKPHIAAQLDAVGVRASLAASKIADSASDLRQHASRKVNQYTSSARQGLSFDLGRYGHDSVRAFTRSGYPLDLQTIGRAATGARGSRDSGGSGNWCCNPSL